ncbi:MAG: branched-chain amino acid transport system ATP-binding protein [Ilumatobacteraceae bacterium]|nr:branched-chain amino acid transport system ATP-binding protein [Ilumatobacteraceae bacterium]
MSALLSVRGLSAGYGPVEVLHGIDLEVHEGQVAVILGANGAGKTTMLRAISGMIPRAGEIEFAGRNIVKAPTSSIVSLGVAHVPQGRGTFTDLTVTDNLRAGAYVRRDREVVNDIALWYETFPRLADRRAQKAGTLSGGEQQMLAIARALMSRPKLLLCDEPSLGLAPLVTRSVFRTIQELNERRGLTVLLVEQNANLALEIAHHVCLLETGTITAAGPPGVIASDEAVRRAYLGA